MPTSRELQERETQSVCGSFPASEVVKLDFLIPGARG